ncbi:MAG: META domain-containing protein [Sinobacteraceae bacterium]|nr:META domain-containing protein [Nevskiaceae bacterium]
MSAVPATVFAAAGLCLLLLAAAEPSAAADPPATTATASAAAAPAGSRAGVTRFASGAALLGELPGQFGGVLPCADCEGIRQTLELHPDGAFYWHSEYLGKPPLDLPDDAGRWLFASDGRTLLLFGGREAPVRLTVRNDGTLRLLDLEGRSIHSTLNYELQRSATAFRPLEPRLRLRGAYTYFADSASLLDCATGRRLPIAPAGDAPALERAYTSARPAPAGAPRIALLEGRITAQMPMEGAGPRPTLLVERFLELAPTGEACPPPPVNLLLEDTRWRLIQLGGEPLPTTSGRRRSREALLLFDAKQALISGSGGCNALSGSYRRNDERITFAQLAGTMLACSGDVMNQERDFFASLGQARRWLVAGRWLELTDDEGRLLARFEAETTPASH